MIKLGPRCANPHCPLQRSVWRTFLKPPRGVFLHKQWLCSPECLNQALEQSLAPVIETTRASRETKSHRFPLGLVMHSLGLVTKESLQSALQAQREAGQGRVGDWLRRQGAVTEPQITQALAVQWSLPIYPLERWDRLLNWAHLLPLGLLHSFQMLPVHCLPASGLLYVAFSSRVDYTALYAIEQMLDFRTQPCLALESQVEKALSELHRRRSSEENQISGPLEPSLISSATQQEVIKFGAREVRVAGCADNIWIRLSAADLVRDLLFQTSTERPLVVNAPAVPPLLVHPW
jgi:hypothetical protein